MMMQFVSCFKIHGAVFFPFQNRCFFLTFPVWEKFFFAQKRARRGGLQIW